MNKEDERSLFALPERKLPPPPSMSSRALLDRALENEQGTSQMAEDISIAPRHRVEHIERPSFTMWKDIPTEAERKKLDAQYPKGWYLNRFERVCPLGEKEQDAGFDIGVIASLWQRFPGGWHLGYNYCIYACPGAISERVALTINQVVDLLEGGNIAGELHQLQLDLQNMMNHTIKHKSFSAALKKMSEVLKDKKYPLLEVDERTIYTCINEVLAVFPINFIPKNYDRVAQKISHYVVFYISLRRMKTILEKKPLSH